MRGKKCFGDSLTNDSCAKDLTDNTKRVTDSRDTHRDLLLYANGWFDERIVMKTSSK